MAEQASNPESTPRKGDLFVAFWHDKAVEASATCIDPSDALKAAQVILATRDGLYAGDQLTVDDMPRPNLIEQGLA